MTDDKDLDRLIRGPSEARKAREAAANPDAVVIELAKMQPLQRAKALKEKAKLLGVPVAALDKEVKRHQSKENKRDFLPHWKVEPWPEEVDGDALLDELRGHFRRHIVLPNEADVALALWVLHTWVFDAFDVTPYLAITSPTRRCGKTVLMTMLYWLCSRAKKTDSMSKAAIYRSVDMEKPTLVLDEVGWVTNLDDERAGIINGGFERNGHVETCEGEGAAIKPRLWSTYCPKALGLIGQLTPTLMDRSIEITMRRKTSSEHAERLRRRDSDEHATLRQKCLRWAEDNIDTLKAAPEMVATSLNDRAVDCWEPLLIIAKQVGGEWLGRALYAAKVLSGGDAVTEEKGVEHLRHMQAVFDGTEWPAVTTKKMTTKLCEDDEKPYATWNKGKPISAKQIGALLRPFTIISDTVHPNQTGEPMAKGYRRARFVEAFERYLSSGEKALSPQEIGSQTYMRTSAAETGTSSDFSIRTETEMYGCEKCEKPANDAGLYACTDRNPPGGEKKKFGASEETSDEPDDTFGGGSDTGSDDAETDPAEFGSIPKATRAQVEPRGSNVRPNATGDLEIPTFLDRRPQPRQDGKWAGTYLSDDDDDFIASGKFK